MVTTSSTISTRVAGLEAEAAAKLERALRPLDEHRRLAERAAHFVADDHAAHRRRDDRFDVVADLLRELRGERAGEALGPRRVHQHARALQVARAPQARGQDEMAFEQRVGGAEFGEDFVVGHHLRSGH